MRFSRGKIDWDLDRGEGVYSLGGGRLSIVESHKDLGVVVDAKLKFHKHVRTVIGKAGRVLGEMLRSTICRTPKFMVGLFASHIRSILDYCSSAWNVGYLGDARALEGVQRRWTREINEMDHLEYAQRLRQLNLYSVYGRLLRADISKCWKVFHSEVDVDLCDLFVRASSLGTRGHTYKLSGRRCETDTKRFFNLRNY